jgi:ankyrin repeat protein
LDCGADINGTGEYGKTALHHALEKNNEDITDIVLAKGVAIETRCPLFLDALKTVGVPSSRASNHPQKNEPHVKLPIGSLAHEDAQSPLGSKLLKAPRSN